MGTEEREEVYIMNLQYLQGKNALNLYYQLLILTSEGQTECL